MATKTKIFTVLAKCYRDVSVKVKAESLEDAIVKAKELKDGDFVEIFGDYNDGSTEIYGVFQS